VHEMRSYAVRPDTKDGEPTMKNADMPAMPIELSGFGLYAPEAHYGLTKREMFAMAAMNGSMSNPDDRYTYEQMAKYSVEYADALLAELERTK